MERQRQRHRPAATTLLLVGESPPAGGTFFYNGNSRLFFEAKKAFEQTLAHSFPDAGEFLHFFQESGCFLIDLCATPVNRLPAPERREARRDAVTGLSNRLAALRPTTILPVALAIEKHVRDAALLAGLEARVRPAAPFPSFGHQARFVRAVSDELKQIVLSRRLAGGQR